MNAQKFRYVLVAAIVLVLAGTAALGFYGVTFLHKLASESDKVKIEAQVNNDASIDANQAEQQFRDPRIARLTEYLEDIIPDKRYRDQFVADINKYAADNNVNVNSLLYAGSAEGTSASIKAPELEGAQAVPVVLTLDANIKYDDFMNFVGAIEGNLQHIQVLSLDLTPSIEDRTVLANAAIEIALYTEK